MKITSSVLTKLETIFHSIGFIVRYEKGSFIGGYCLLQQQKVVIVNKFFPIESKANTLIDILHQLDNEAILFDNEQIKLLKQIAPTSKWDNKAQSSDRQALP